MRAPFKLAAFAAALVVALAASLGLGRISGIDGQASVEDASHDEGDGGGGHDDGGGQDVPGGEGAADEGHAEEHGDPASPGASLPDGLQVSAEGYTLDVLSHAETAGRAEPFEFRIIGPDGEAVTEFIESHEAKLHLIVVRRDLTGYQHVHPEMAADGTWTIPLEFDRAGTFRAFADFLPAGHDDALTLGADVELGGDFEPAEAPHPDRTVEVGGYTVILDGDLVPGQTAELTLSVSRDGVPVTDLQPYLAAAGHLVVLRRGDLAYLHVHPEESGATAGTGPDVGFAAEVPSSGSYGLFFEFQHENTVHTAEFTLEAGGDHDH
jgi:hypothetical protein